MIAGDFVNSSVIRAALQERFCRPEWALFFEVANGTGGTIRRYADAVAMNLFPSRGLEVHGFEVKISRSDWQREMKNPNKAEAIWKYCDRWWIVAPGGIVRKDELPPTWGLMELTGGKGSNDVNSKLRIAVQAPKLEPQELTRYFIAALLRRASEADQSVVDQLVDRKLRVLREQDRQHIERTIDSRLSAMRDKLAKVSAFEKQLGVSITDWNATPAQGAALRAIGAVGLDKTWGHIYDIRKRLDAIIREINTVIACNEVYLPPASESRALEGADVD